MISPPPQSAINDARFSSRTTHAPERSNTLNVTIGLSAKFAKRRGEPLDEEGALFSRCCVPALVRLALSRSRRSRRSQWCAVGCWGCGRERVFLRFLTFSSLSTSAQRRPPRHTRVFALQLDVSFLNDAFPAQFLARSRGDLRSPPLRRCDERSTSARLDNLDGGSQVRCVPGVCACMLLLTCTLAPEAGRS